MTSASRPPVARENVVVFPSDLGWMGLVVSGKAVRQLTFGHPSANSARKALETKRPKDAKPLGKPLDALPPRLAPLVRRLQAFASGKADPLGDISIDLGPLSQFADRVLKQCRRIPYGCTTTYAALAAKAGSPGAARAVGNCMAANRIPLVVPCHRVVQANGRLGRFSAPGGAAMKRRLLQLEAQNWARIP